MLLSIKADTEISALQSEECNFKSGYGICFNTTKANAENLYIGNNLWFDM